MFRNIVVFILVIAFVSPVMAQEDPGKWLTKELSKANLLEGGALEVAAMRPTEDPHRLSSFCMSLIAKNKDKEGKAALLRAFYLIKMGSHYEALGHLGKAILQAPESKAPHALRVVCYASLGMKNAVVAGLERCLKLSPKDPISQVRLCRALLFRKRRGDAKRAFLLAKGLVRSQPGLAKEFASSFPKAKQKSFFDNIVADQRVEKAIAKLRALRPTLCPTYFQRSPEVLPLAATAKTAQASQAVGSGQTAPSPVVSPTQTQTATK